LFGREKIVLCVRTFFFTTQFKAPMRFKTAARMKPHTKSANVRYPLFDFTFSFFVPFFFFFFLAAMYTLSGSGSEYPPNP
jgi:hypothetical protein